MRIVACIHTVEDRGDKLELTAQGRQPNAADWQPYLSVTLQIPLTPKSQRAYHVGREIVVTVEPRP